MKAAVITRAGGPEVLEIADVPPPEPRTGEVLVRVRASALNRADTLQRQGRYPAPADAPANVPGLEIAGEIVACGPGSTRWAVGDRVFGIIGGGGNAELVTIDARHLARIPSAMPFDVAAAVPEAFITAHDALMTQAGMRKSESVLVHAVGSGVGLAAIQLVHAYGGRAFGTARTADKIEKARAFGLLDGTAVDADPGAFIEHARRWTSGTGIDVTLDLVGGAYLAAGIDAAAMRGRLILIGLLAGRTASLNLGAILSKRLSIQGTVLRSRSAGEKAAVTAAFERDVLPLLERGTIKPVVDRVLPLDRIRDAHALLESNQTFGKVVLTH